MVAGTSTLASGEVKSPLRRIEHRLMTEDAADDDDDEAAEDEEDAAAAAAPDEALTRPPPADDVGRTFSSTTVDAAVDAAVCWAVDAVERASNP